MPKLIKFARTFPSYHPRKAEKTFFVEKILRQLGVNYLWPEYLQTLLVLNTKNIASGKLQFEDLDKFHKSLLPVRSFDTKPQTIRSGKRFKPGDYFTPTVWSGIPYRSPQIIFWDDVEVKKTWGFELLGGKAFMHVIATLSDRELEEIASNDGLSFDDFVSWFKNFSINFDGQIICWDQRINY